MLFTSTVAILSLESGPVLAIIYASHIILSPDLIMEKLSYRVHSTSYSVYTYILYFSCFTISDQQSNEGCKKLQLAYKSGRSSVAVLLSASSYASPV